MATSGLIGVVGRTTPGQSIVDAFAASEEDTEVNWLLKTREAGRLVVDVIGHPWQPLRGGSALRIPGPDASSLRRYAWSLDRVALSVIVEQALTRSKTASQFDEKEWHWR